ncbi:uncharacterized protein LOC122963986 [Acropora millepora]|uniref:uncharacterized protein LOC122963986 n=1 Tax=Acropora millepora TaxID=45264 RepID=UPI001CF5C3DB|nr:uncharacterized protein LOC122963986 [Acropora millepora]
MYKRRLQEDCFSVSFYFLGFVIPSKFGIFCKFGFTEPVRSTTANQFSSTLDRLLIVFIIKERHQRISSEAEITAQTVGDEELKQNDFKGFFSRVPPKMKRGIIEESEHGQPAGLDESISFKSGTVSKGDVLLIAHELGSSWKMVGRVLDVPDAVIDHIEADESKVAEKGYIPMKMSDNFKQLRIKKWMTLQSSKGIFRE